MRQEYKDTLELIKEREEEVDILFKKLDRKKRRFLDPLFYGLHYDIFFGYDCLDCGNCCKCVGPNIIYKDIERISKHLKVRPKQFYADYLQQDDEESFSFRESPCPLINESDNFCFIYRDRPRACQEFPHTHQSMTKELLKKTQLNAYICPAVAEIVLHIIDNELA